MQKITLTASGSSSQIAEDIIGDGSVLTLALAASQSLRALVGLKLTPLGLASGQDRFLIALHTNGPLTVSDLAAELNVRPSTVSKMLDRLTARGLTKRVSHGSDARRINVELTDDGRAICDQLRVLYDAVDDELHSHLNPHDKQRMVEGLSLLNEVVGRRLKRLR